MLCAPPLLLLQSWLSQMPIKGRVPEEQTEPMIHDPVRVRADRSVVADGIQEDKRRRRKQRMHV
jgi:hypothetical protein